jgi:hypothetical protein
LILVKASLYPQNEISHLLLNWRLTEKRVRFARNFDSQCVKKEDPTSHAISKYVLIYTRVMQKLKIHIGCKVSTGKF